MNLLKKLFGRAGLNAARPPESEIDQDRQLWLELMKDDAFSEAHNKALDELRGSLKATDMKWQMSKWAMRAYATERACIATGRDALAERLVAFIMASGEISRPKSRKLSRLMLSRIYGERGQFDKQDRARQVVYGARGDV